MKHNKPFLIILFSTALILATPFLKANDSDPPSISDGERARHEATGVIGGAVLGGLVAGPVGAVVTAAFGNWVSENAIAKKENVLLARQIESQQEQLLAVQAEYRALQAIHQLALQENRSTQSQLQSLRKSKAEMTATAGCCDDAEITLHFTTGSSEVQPLYESKLAEFVALASQHRDAVVTVIGHADRRGDSSANMMLSRQRVTTVVNRLRHLGLSEHSLDTSAYGEEAPDSREDSLENNFFDRRVVLKLVPATSPMLTRADD